MSTVDEPWAATDQLRLPAVAPVLPTKAMVTLAVKVLERLTTSIVDEPEPSATSVAVDRTIPGAYSVLPTGKGSGTVSACVDERPMGRRNGIPGVGRAPLNHTRPLDRAVTRVG